MAGGVLVVAKALVIRGAFRPGTGKSAELLRMSVAFN